MSSRSHRRGKGSHQPSQHKPRRVGGVRSPRRSGAEFWGDAATLPPPRRDVRIADDPTAVARSLGPPPLPGSEAVAEYYFAAVYDRAVTLAGALAAAGGLIKPEELLDERGD